jgi:peptidoglycan/LPS O-acetylase OafA/YrhL
LPQEKIEFANTLRGVAALCVMVEHYYSFFTGDRSVIARLINAPALSNNYQLSPDYLFWVYSIPHLIWASLGVALFFVISGFVIPFSVKSGSIAAFLFARAFRIYPLYIVGFSITLLSLYVSGWYFSRDWQFTYEQVLPHFIPGLRELYGSPYIDGILWTLEIEIKFYIICALIAPLIRRGSVKVFMVPIAVALADYLLCKNVAGYEKGSLSQAAPFLCFMFIGVAFHYLRARIIRPPVGAAVIAGVFSVFVLSLAYGPTSQYLTIVWSYGVAVALFGIAARFPQPFGKSRVGNFLADISYPLYVVHGVTGYALLRILTEVGMPGALALPVTVIAVFTIAWSLHNIVEDRSRACGKKLFVLLFSNPRPAENRQGSMNDRPGVGFFGGTDL